MKDYFKYFVKVIITNTAFSNPCFRDPRFRDPRIRDYHLDPIFLADISNSYDRESFYLQQLKLLKIDNQKSNFEIRNATFAALKSTSRIFYM